MDPDDWKSKISKSVDFLLVESTGLTKNGPWQDPLGNSSTPSPNLRMLLQHCQSLGIPTIFWNKEDPLHFDYFLRTASLFDIIFTSDKDMVLEYKKMTNTENSHFLPPAVQPALHNPARNHLRYAAGDIAFLGTYAEEGLSDQHQNIDMLLGAASKLAQKYKFDFKVFLRKERGRKKYKIPSHLSQHAEHPFLSSEMFSAYGAFKVVINGNAEKTSSGVHQQQIFETFASGAACVSTSSSIAKKFFPQDEVPIVDSTDQAQQVMRSLVTSSELRERLVHTAQRHIWENHTYRHRAIDIINIAKVDYKPVMNPMVSVICSTNRDTSIQHLLNQVRTQTYKNIELIVLGHGIDFREGLVSRAADMGVTLKLLTAPPAWSLGRCLNRLIEESSGDVVAKFDDDDYYCPNYLRDQLLALRYSKADLVGKSSIYFYLEGPDLIARRWPHTEHKWTNFVAGATFVGKRETFTSTPFEDLTTGEDSAFLKALQAAGCKVYSTDRFNYMAVRKSTENHTWKISDTEILSYSSVETFGLNINHITV